MRKKDKPVPAQGKLRHSWAGETPKKNQPKQRLRVDSKRATTLKVLRLVMKPRREQWNKKQRAVNKQKQNGLISVSCTACCLAEGTEYDKQPRNWRMAWGERRNTGVWRKAAVFSLSVFIIFNSNTKAVIKNSNWQEIKLIKASRLKTYCPWKVMSLADISIKLRAFCPF